MTVGASIAVFLAAADVAPALVARLAKYGEIVLDANAAMNLTAAREPEAFAAQILDALTLTADIDGPLIDIGSGAGLPGIPLALATGQPVVLVDSSKKKADFLGRTLCALEIAGEAIGLRAETLARDPVYRETFTCATVRAVGSAPSVAELSVPFLAVGGRAFLQRGAMDEREREAIGDAAPMLGAEVVEERLVQGDRRILILVKRMSTPTRFPRRDGVPQKRPLCF